ncbi:hypothetical protein Cgig2_031266 [Carnegiea gigantea]|uniref:Retrotransposon gag domain-containing protein n=1 Tax=Carnegiea gigantea TaxID=171969 RepID=A0A9Q1QJY6_9CARY|nr:hypothetical protein Cgig2_031266 [Carnegiea gigantea]
MSESIRKSILFLNSAREIWVQLEQRFSLSNGSRKYRINKEIYVVKQNHSSVSEYYTRLKCLREELEDTNELPKLSVITDEITPFMKAIVKQREEQRLFQFLNGLDDKYGPQRSQLLLMTPLPSVEAACFLIQREVSQREILEVGNLEVEPTALYSRNENAREKCWLIIGYPAWHPKVKKFPEKNLDKNQACKRKFKGTNDGKIVANAETMYINTAKVNVIMQQRIMEHERGLNGSH